MEENKITKHLTNSYIEDIGGNSIPILDNSGNIINNLEAKENALWIDFNDKHLEQFVENFTSYADENDIDFNKFDYETHGADYYAEKFPNFDPEVHEILAECSKKKVEDFRDTNNNTITKEKGEFVVKFD